MGSPVVEPVAITLEPLRQRPSLADIWIYERSCHVALYRRFVTVLVATLVVAAAMAVGFVWLQGSGLLAQAPFLAIIPLFYGIGTAAMFLWYAIILSRRVRIAAFAWGNDWTYNDLVYTVARNGSAFRRVSQSMERQVVYGDNPRMPFTLGQHYSVARDRSSGATMQRPFSFIEIPLPTSVPNMVLKNKRHSRIPTLGLAAKNSALQLEGEFGQRFTLLVPADYEQDALYIFTPDIMARILDVAPGTEVELAGDRVYIYVPVSVRFDRPEVMAAAMTLTEEFFRRFEKRTELYTDDREVIGAASGVRVGLAGQRLRGEGISLLAIAGTAAVVLTGGAGLAFALFGAALFGG